MTEKRISCTLLGIGTGPPCEDCGKRTDDIRVESSEHQFYLKEGTYCFHCTRKGVVNV